MISVKLKAKVSHPSGKSCMKGFKLKILSQLISIKKKIKAKQKLIKRFEHKKNIISCPPCVCVCLCVVKVEIKI